jgi:hypothetical protein
MMNFTQSCTKPAIVRRGKGVYIRAMRGVLLVLTAGALALAPDLANGGDLRAKLLSERTALVAADAPPELAEFLKDTWDALVCIPGRGITAGDGGWPAIDLPVMPGDITAARDSVAAWRDRYGISVVFAPAGSDRTTWAEATRQAGLALFEPQNDFAAGDFALPLEDGYAVYRGPVGQPFAAGPQRLERLSLAASMRNFSAGYRELIRRAGDLQGAFRQDGQADLAATEQLLYATLAADSIGGSADSAAALAAIYAARWGHTLGWLLAPACDAKDMELYRGIARPGSISFQSKASVTVNMGAMSLAPATTEAEWGADFPVELAPGQRITIPVRLTAGAAARGGIVLEGRFEYRGFKFTRRLPLDVSVVEPLELAFDPPILQFSEGARRNDPDYTIAVIPGTLGVHNRSDAALDFALDWSAEDPISIAATDRQLTLAAGEARKLPFTLSAPKELKSGDYDIGTRAHGPSGIDVSARAALWIGDATIDKNMRVGVLGSAGAWLGALGALGIGAYPLVASAAGDADLSGLAALVIPGEVDSPNPLGRTAVEEFAQSGHVVLVELTPASARWLPWETRLVQKPGPYAANFYNDDLAWWRAPNPLVSGCFAAAQSDRVYTLPAGSTAWEPLLVDDGGKSFMYRRAAGRGWYVVVHQGWSPRFANLDRRALLGLVNLVTGPRP